MPPLKSVAAKKKSNVINLDAIIAAKQEAGELVDNEIRTLRYAGRDWKVKSQPNAFALATMIDGDSGAGFLDYVLSFVVAEDRDEFATVLRNDDDLDFPKLNAIAEALGEEFTGRPL
jgi:hypothetical protein